MVKAGEKSRYPGLGSILMLALASLLLPSGAPANPFTDKGTQPIITHPIELGSDCSLCHGNYDPGNHIEPFPTWSGSMMAQSTRDPIFWAALDVANNDLPAVGSWCLRCHAPGAWLAGRSDDPNGCDLIGDIDLPGPDFDGVTCQLCHRMMINPSPPVGEEPGARPSRR